MNILLPALALATLLVTAACDREPERGSAAPPTQTYSSGTSTGSSATSSGASTGATTRTTPAEITPPASAEDKREGSNPQQGQVDPKQSEQHRDFQQRGDEKGPVNPSAQPR